MGAIRIVGLMLVLSALGGLWAQGALADAAAPMYDPSKVYAIDLTLPKASKEELEAHPKDAYVQGFLSLRETAGDPGTEKSPPIVDALEVGIKLKGNAVGSFRDLKDGKAAFKIKCNFVSGKKCLGLKKMTLNNMVQDPSMIHETLAYAAFRAAGVPASRTGYAYVHVNGEDFGLYMNIETLDDVGLERWFGKFDDPQHLYEGEYGTDVAPGKASAYSVDEGDEVDRSDLEALIDAVAGDELPFSDRVAGLADLEEMTRMWAAEKYTGQWDGYAGAGPTYLPFNQLPNNYYLFSDAAGEFQMLPWGTDQTWEPSLRVSFDGEAGILFDACLGDPACASMYWNALKGVRDAMAGLDLDPMAAETAALLEPWEQLEQLNKRHEHSIGEIKARVGDTRDFIATRLGEADAWLAAHAPGSGRRPVQPLPAEALPASAGGPVQGLRILGAELQGGALVTRMHLSSAGEVRQSAKIDTDDGAIGACAVRFNVQVATDLTLRCYLSGAVKRRLRVRWLKLELRTRFIPEAGSQEVVADRVHLRRIAVP